MDSDIIKKNYYQIIKLSQIALNYLDNMKRFDDTELKLIRINIELNKLLFTTTQLNKIYIESSTDSNDIDKSFKNITI